MGKNIEWIQAREQEKERLTQALEVSPNDPAALADLGTFFTRREENFGQAEELFQQAMDVAPENARILAQYAGFWAWRFRRAPWTGDPADECRQKAEQYFLQAIELNPSCSEAHGGYATLLWEVKKMEDACQLPASTLAAAEEHYQAAIAVDSVSSGTLVEYAYFLYWAKQDYAPIPEIFERTIAANPHNQGTYLDYAGVLADIQPDLDKVEEIYQRALEVPPENPHLHEHAARYAEVLAHYVRFILKHKDDKSAADPLLEKLRKIDPDSCLLKQIEGEL